MPECDRGYNVEYSTFSMTLTTSVSTISFLLNAYFQYDIRNYSPNSAPINYNSRQKIDSAVQALNKKRIEMQKFLSIILVIIVLGLGSGCTSTDTGPYETDELPLGTKAFDDDFKPRDQ
jgi:hypothetical protein